MLVRNLWIITCMVLMGALTQSVTAQTLRYYKSDPEHVYIWMSNVEGMVTANKSQGAWQTTPEVPAEKLKPFMPKGTKPEDLKVANLASNLIAATNTQTNIRPLQLKAKISLSLPANASEGANGKLTFRFPDGMSLDILLTKTNNGWDVSKKETVSPRLEPWFGQSLPSKLLSSLSPGQQNGDWAKLIAAMETTNPPKPLLIWQGRGNSRTEVLYLLDRPASLAPNVSPDHTNTVPTQAAKISEPSADSMKNIPNKSVYIGIGVVLGILFVLVGYAAVKNPQLFAKFSPKKAPVTQTRGNKSTAPKTSTNTGTQKGDDHLNGDPDGTTGQQGVVTVNPDIDLSGISAQITTAINSSASGIGKTLSSHATEINNKLESILGDPPPSNHNTSRSNGPQSTRRLGISDIVKELGQLRTDLASAITTKQEIDKLRNQITQYQTNEQQYRETTRAAKEAEARATQNLQRVQEQADQKIRGVQEQANQNIRTLQQSLNDANREVERIGTQFRDASRRLELSIGQVEELQTTLTASTRDKEAIEQSLKERALRMQQLKNLFDQIRAAQMNLPARFNDRELPRYIALLLDYSMVHLLLAEAEMEQTDTTRAYKVMMLSNIKRLALVWPKDNAFKRALNIIQMIEPDLDASENRFTQRGGRSDELALFQGVVTTLRDANVAVGYFYLGHTSKGEICATS